MLKNVNTSTFCMQKSHDKTWLNVQIVNYTQFSTQISQSFIRMTFLPNLIKMAKWRRGMLFKAIIADEYIHVRTVGTDEQSLPCAQHVHSADELTDNVSNIFYQHVFTYQKEDIFFSFYFDKIVEVFKQSCTSFVSINVLY